MTPHYGSPGPASQAVLAKLQSFNSAFKIAGALALAAIVVGVLVAWSRGASNEVPPGFARSNGRIEAERVDIAAKLPGRLKEVLVKEGDTVTLGQVLARMDTAELEADIRQAEAAVRQSEQQLDQSYALVAQRKSELAFAEQQLERSLALVDKGYSTREQVDQRRAAKDTAIAALNSATSQIALSKATIEAAVARVESLKTNLADSTLRAPRAGRIQYRLALPGEVLGAGGKVLTLLDLTDVYMTIFLPTHDAGRLSLGSESRVILDAAPEYVVPASVSFVAADAQFTPKYVETKTEREKLMFRIKVQIPREVLEKYSPLVKTGIPGVAYVRIDSAAGWPKSLSVSLPP